MIKPLIREEKERDYDLISEINYLAFKRMNEGSMISKLRETEKFIPDLSLVAELNKKLIGHILFYPIDIISEKKRFEILSLAPMAVIPEFQKKGVGGKLIDAGLQNASRLNFSAVVVLGHPDYYPRFGFWRASKWNLKPPIEVPDEAFMAIELVEGWLNDKTGVIEFPAQYYDAI